MAVREKNVRGLDVPVHDPLGVRVVQRIRHFARDLERFVDRQRATVLDSLRKSRSVDERHHVIRVSVVLNLAGEPFAAHNACEIGCEDLQRNAISVTQIPGEVNRSHPAASELSLDRIAVIYDSGECQVLRG